MRQLQIGDVTITSIIERDGPWRTPAAMFPDYDEAIGAAHLKTLDPEIFDPATGMMYITYQTFVVRTAAPHDPGRYLHRRRQRLPRADGFFQAALSG